MNVRTCPTRPDWKDGRIVVHPCAVRPANLACSDIAMSFTRGSMFDPVRAWIMSKNKLLGDLFKCFFCSSHWLAFAGVAIYQPRPLPDMGGSDCRRVRHRDDRDAVLGIDVRRVLHRRQFHALRERMLKGPAHGQP